MLITGCKGMCQACAEPHLAESAELLCCQVVLHLHSSRQWEVMTSKLATRLFMIQNLPHFHTDTMCEHCRLLAPAAITLYPTEVTEVPRSNYVNSIVLKCCISGRSARVQGVVVVPKTTDQVRGPLVRGLVAHPQTYSVGHTRQSTS